MNIDDWERTMACLETDTDELPFARREYEQRLRGVRQRVQEEGLDALVVTTPENIHYLTGYDATVRSEGWYQALVVSADGTLRFVVPAFESPNVAVGTWIDEWRSYDIRTAGGSAAVAGVSATVETLHEMGVADGRLGVEQDSLFLTYEHVQRLASGVDAEFVPVSGFVEGLRAVKSDAEMAYVREAATVAGSATEAGFAAVEPGASENDVAAAVSATLVREGSGHLATQPYVTTGTRSALPHARWNRRTIQENEVVYFEVGAAVERYHAAVLRTGYVGEPPPVVARVGEVVADGLTAGIDAIAPGVSAAHVDSAARSVVEDAGFGSQFANMTGYSIGVAFKPGWGEGNVVCLGPDDETTLEPNMVFHMPVIVFLPEHGAIGCSETVRVTEDGAEPLVGLDRELVVV